MEDPTVQLPPLQNPKKRKFVGSSSNSNSPLVEPDLIEIPPPATWKSKPQKQKSIVDCELIVLDSDDTDDVVIIDEKIAPNAKGKKPMHNYLSGHKVPVKDEALSTSTKGVSNSSISFIDDNFDFGGMDLSQNYYDSECALLQAHFDSINIPSGVEATVPWWAFGDGIEEQFVSASEKSNYTAGTFEPDKFQLSSKSNPIMAKKNSASNMVLHGSKLPLYGHATNPSSYANYSGVVPLENEWPPFPGHDHSFATNSSSYDHYSGVVPLENEWQPFPGHGPSFAAGFIPVGNKPFQGWKNVSPFDASANQPMSHVGGSNPMGKIFTGNVQGSQYFDPVRLDDGISSQISPPASDEQGDGESSIVKKLELFKKFDTLEDHSDHLFTKTKQSGSQSKNSWLRKITDEWKMLERDLPGTIYVRVYEARIDLLRAAIVGADGTPYHDGLFFFDVNFPSTYPNKAPSVKYHAHGLRINPNLYNCGKVCLSLLGTWGGKGAENWQPGKSNMLQVLVSIQGLILNAEPYYNEPGYANSKTNQHGRQQSKHYSENTFLLSLKTMLYTMRNPPKHFEDLVFGHFYMRAHDILASCRAYLDGAEVGSYDKSKNARPSTTTQSTSPKCSEHLKNNLPTYIKSLVETFTKIGVKDCEKFLVPTEKDVNQLSQHGSVSRGKSKSLKPMAPWNYV